MSTTSHEEENDQQLDSSTGQGSAKDGRAESPSGESEVRVDLNRRGRPRRPRRELSSAKMGLIGVLVGALVSGSISLWTQGLTISATNAQAARQTNSTVYFDYLNAADDFNTKTSNMLGYFGDQAKLGNKNVSLPKDLTDKWSAARYAYQGMVNKLYAFGSDRAWDVHEKIAANLPSSVSIDAQPLTIRHDNKAFTAAYREFLGVVCSEVVASPRGGCGQ